MVATSSFPPLEPKKVLSLGIMEHLHFLHLPRFLRTAFSAFSPYLYSRVRFDCSGDEYAPSVAKVLQLPPPPSGSERQTGTFTSSSHLLAHHHLPLESVAYVDLTDPRCVFLQLLVLQCNLCAPFIYSVPIISAPDPTSTPFITPDQPSWHPRKLLSPSRGSEGKLAFFSYRSFRSSTVRIGLVRPGVLSGTP